MVLELVWFRGIRDWEGNLLTQSWSSYSMVVRRFIDVKVVVILMIQRFCRLSKGIILADMWHVLCPLFLILCRWMTKYGSLNHMKVWSMKVGEARF